MGICWYCWWGWPKSVADIYERALAALDGDESELLYGPGHIVWADENFAREHVEWCLHEGEAGEYWHDYATDKSKKIVLDSLRELLALPDSILDSVPEEYDGENPERYPPPSPIPFVVGKA